MSKPRLTYFPVRGRAELARLIMVQAGVEWDEVAVNPESLGQLKQSGVLAFDQVPLYEEGDFALVQSNTIARYLARKNGLYGSNEHEGAKIDEIVEDLPML